MEKITCSCCGRECFVPVFGTSVKYTCWLCAFNKQKEEKNEI